MKQPGAPDRSWIEQGACVGSDLDFFALERREWLVLKAVCLECPVRLECLSYALETRAAFGMWGGANQREIREAGGYDSYGNAYPYTKALHCPACRDFRQVTLVKRVASCGRCGFEWPHVKARKPRQPRQQRLEEAS